MCFHAHHFVFCGSLFNEAADLLVDRGLDRFEINARLSGSLNTKLAAHRARADIGGGIGGDLVFVDETLIETGVLALAEYVAG